MSLLRHYEEIQKRRLTREKRDDEIRQYFAMGLKPYQIVERVGCSQARVRAVIEAEKERLRSVEFGDLKQQHAYAVNQLDLLWRETWTSYMRSCEDELITENFEVLDSIDGFDDNNQSGVNQGFNHGFGAGLGGGLGGTKTLKKTTRTREGGIHHLRTLLEILRFKNKLLGLESLDLTPDDFNDVIDNFDAYAADIVRTNQSDIEIETRGSMDEIQALIGNL